MMDPMFLFVVHALEVIGLVALLYTLGRVVRSMWRDFVQAELDDPEGYRYWKRVL